LRFGTFSDRAGCFSRKRMERSHGFWQRRLAVVVGHPPYRLSSCSQSLCITDRLAIRLLKGSLIADRVMPVFGLAEQRKRSSLISLDGVTVVDENRFEGTARNLGGKPQEALAVEPAMPERKLRAQSIRPRASLRAFMARRLTICERLHPPSKDRPAARSKRNPISAPLSHTA
jgi:hypothetical protein